MTTDGIKIYNPRIKKIDRQSTICSYGLRVPREIRIFLDSEDHTNMVMYLKKEDALGLIAQISEAFKVSNDF